MEESRRKKKDIARHASESCRDDGASHDVDAMKGLVVAIGDVRDEVVAIEGNGASARTGRMNR